MTTQVILIAVIIGLVLVCAGLLVVIKQYRGKKEVKYDDSESFYSK